MIQKGRTGGDQFETSRSEEHTSELQSPCNLVCRLLLEKKKISRSCYRLRPRRAFERNPQRSAFRFHALNERDNLPITTQAAPFSDFQPTYRPASEHDS